MVFVMVAIASIFFLLADQVIRIVVTFVLGVAG
jgi:preprotein translocase subunit SecE